MIPVLTADPLPIESLKPLKVIENNITDFLLLIYYFNLERQPCLYQNGIIAIIMVPKINNLIIIITVGFV